MLYRYVIAGYPPFLKNLVDAADLDWSLFDVSAVVGGEGMSEGLRTALERCFRRVISSFGASDLEIGLANENDFTIALRRELEVSSGLAKDLFGGASTLPMVFQYDPLDCLVEEGPGERLWFTLNRLANVSPRVRYDLGDRGVVRSHHDVMTVLRDHRVRLDSEPKTRLPLMFHFGRAEQTVSFYGANITPENVQAALLRLPPLSCVEGFALHPFEDDNADKRLDIWVEHAACAGARAHAHCTCLGWPGGGRHAGSDGRHPPALRRAPIALNSA